MVGLWPCSSLELTNYLAYLYISSIVFLESESIVEDWSVYLEVKRVVFGRFLGVGGCWKVLEIFSNM